MSHTRSRRLQHSCMFALATATSLLTGCLERREFLTVQPNGALHVRLEYKANSIEEFDDADVSPSLAAGWLADIRSEKDPGPADAVNQPEGKETFILTAEAAFPRNFNIPPTYARAADTNAPAYLQFPTAITQERRADGLYTHFTRTYEPRKWIAIDRLHKTILEPAIAQVADIDLTSWTADQRAIVVNAFADFELAKILHVARESWAALAPEKPQDTWLLTADALRGFRADLDVSNMLTLLETLAAKPDAHALNPDAEAQQSTDVTAETQRLRTTLLENLKDTLLHVARLDATLVPAIMADVNLRLLAIQVTEDLDDDRFIIEVQMPGEIVASNATRTGNSTAIWVFDGSSLKDVPMELMVTSRQPK